MSKSQRDKGKRGELDVAKLYQGLGGPYASARRHLETRAIDAGYDLDGCGDDVPEVKNRARPVPVTTLFKIRVPVGGGHRVLWNKVNRAWVVTLDADRYLDLLKIEMGLNE